MVLILCLCVCVCVPAPLHRLVVVSPPSPLALLHTLCSVSPSITLHLGTLCRLVLSGALVVQLQDIFTQPGATWKVELLYIPVLLPFVAASVVTLLVHKRDLKAHGVTWVTPFKSAWAKVSGEGSTGHFCVLLLNGASVGWGLKGTSA